jgi:hypothetical protein
VATGADPAPVDEDGLTPSRYAFGNRSITDLLPPDAGFTGPKPATLQPPATSTHLRPLLKPPVEDSDATAAKPEKKPPPPIPNAESVQLLEDLLVALDLSKYASRFRTEGIDVWLLECVFVLLLTL